MKLSDFKGLFKKAFLEVIEVNNPYQDYYTVKMRYPEKLTWIPGEHGLFSLPDHKINGKKWRAFSVASSPDEGYMLIGTRTGKEISSFKNVLINLKQGERVKIQGPFGWFKLFNNNKPVVLIAGGIGITPIRSLLTVLQNKKIKTEIIYSSRDYYLFENEIDNIVTNNDKINQHKSKDRIETLNSIKSAVNLLNNEATYYISGSMGFIKSIKTELKSNGIKNNNIINDPFLGY